MGIEQFIRADPNLKRMPPRRKKKTDGANPIRLGIVTAWFLSTNRTSSNRTTDR